MIVWSMLMLDLTYHASADLVMFSDWAVCLCRIGRWTRDGKSEIRFDEALKDPLNLNYTFVLFHGLTFLDEIRSIDLLIPNYFKMFSNYFRLFCSASILIPGNGLVSHLNVYCWFAERYNFHSAVLSNVDTPNHIPFGAFSSLCIMPLGSLWPTSASI